MVRYVPSTPCHLPAHDSILFAGLPEGEADGLADGEELGLAEGPGEGVTGFLFASGWHAANNATPAINTKPTAIRKLQIENLICLLIVFPQNKLPRGSFSAGWQPAGPAVLVSRLNIVRQTSWFRMTKDK